jgi:hypothetical protein
MLYVTTQSNLFSFPIESNFSSFFSISKILEKTKRRRPLGKPEHAWGGRKKKTSVALDRKRTIPTERPPLSAK